MLVNKPTCFSAGRHQSIARAAWLVHADHQRPRRDHDLRVREGLLRLLRADRWGPALFTNKRTWLGAGHVLARHASSPYRIGIDKYPRLSSCLQTNISVYKQTHVDGEVARAHGMGWGARRYRVGNGTHSGSRSLNLVHNITFLPVNHLYTFIHAHFVNIHNMSHFAPLYNWTITLKN
jgi:hypothetical protein